MSWAEIGKALNSTVKDPENFMPLDLLIQYRMDIQNKKNIYTRNTSGTEQVFVPIWATKAKITACAGGGGGGLAYVYSVTGTTTRAGGGGGAAIIDEEVEVSADIRNSYISVTVGSGGKGAYVIADASGESYTQYNPSKGRNTTISALGISLIGGAAGGETTGGAAGGTGGGKGGDGAYSSSSVSVDGYPGISGSGGVGYTSGSNKFGGGGGSLGSGGEATSSASSSNSGCDGSRGGGGGAILSTGHACNQGGNGGTGYVKIEWLL